MLVQRKNKMTELASARFLLGTYVSLVPSPQDKLACLSFRVCGINNQLYPTLNTRRICLRPFPHALAGLDPRLPLRKDFLTDCNFNTPPEPLISLF